MNTLYLWDIKVFYWLNSFAFQKDWIDALIIFRAKYLGYLVVGALVFFVVAPLFKKYYAYTRINREMVCIALASGVVARFVLKPLISVFYVRPRPYEALPMVRKLFEDSTAAFPSGHALFFFALAMGIAFYYPRTSILFFLAAFSITVARVMAGVHWPTDIIAGAILGVLTAFIVKKIFDCVKNKNTNALVGLK